jgi:hypothetical protein
MTSHEKDQLKVIARIIETLVPQINYTVELNDDEVRDYTD